jgi:hypothetical protein
MTVRILTETQKSVIAQQYSFIKVPVKDLAKDYKVSIRTIQRVLTERGVNQVRKSIAIPILNRQIEVLHSTDKPGVIGTIKGFFKSIFSSKQQISDDQTTK